MSEEKIRLDLLVVKEGLATSREKAREYILSGKIYVNDKVSKKCGLKLEESSKIEMKGDAIPFVSRAGLKLEKAIENFNVDLKGLTCIDVGASTGGFTECMLNNGAKKVYAIDVGRDQLAEKLRVDPRVVSMEGTNIRGVTYETLGELCDFVSIDVSFISLEKVIPHVVPLLKKDALGVALIKPQFEAGRGNHSKKGVVKSKKVHEEIINKIVELIHENGLYPLELDFSGIKGQNGNIEYLIHFKMSNNSEEQFNRTRIKEVINYAHDILNLEEIWKK